VYYEPAAGAFLASGQMSFIVLSIGVTAASSARLSTSLHHVTAEQHTFLICSGVAADRSEGQLR